MSNIKPIEQQMWAVVDKNGNIQYNTIAADELTSKYHFIVLIVEYEGKECSWQFLEKQGYRCVKVNVKIEPI